MVFVEYFGLPGCGKTTHLKNDAVNSEVCSYYINGASIAEESGSVRKFNKLNRLLKGKTLSIFLRSLHFQQKYKLDKSTKRFVRAAQILAINMNYWNNKKNNNEFIINDNGYAQLLVSILKRTEIKDKHLFINDYFKTFFHCKQSYHFVYITTLPEICLERIIKRGKRLSITMEGVDTLSELYKEKELFEMVELQLISYFKNNANITVKKENNNI